MAIVPITRWVPAIGQWDLSESGRAVYLGPQPEPGRPYGICLSNSRLTEGEVQVKVNLPVLSPDLSGRILLGYRSLEAEYYVIGIGGNSFAYTLVHFQPSSGWQPLTVAGSEKSLIAQKTYQLVVSVQGQRITLSDGDIQVFEHVLASPLPAGQVGLFAWGNARVEFTDVLADKRGGTAFVVMEFSELYKQLHDQIIKPVAERECFGLRAFHVGETFGRVILQDIQKGIENARVVIAEITPANKNVFYELGLAHGLKKQTILLVQKGTVLPFDIQGYRCILYENTIAGKSEVEDQLAHHLDAILNG